MHSSNNAFNATNFAGDESCGGWRRGYFQTSTWRELEECPSCATFAFSWPWKQFLQHFSNKTSIVGMYLIRKFLYGVTYVIYVHVFHMLINKLCGFCFYFSTKQINQSELTVLFQASGRTAGSIRLFVWNYSHCNMAVQGNVIVNRSV